MYTAIVILVVAAVVATGFLLSFLAVRPPRIDRDKDSS